MKKRAAIAAVRTPAHDEGLHPEPGPPTAPAVGRPHPQAQTRALDAAIILCDLACG